MLTSWSEVFDAGGIVDGVGVDPPAGARERDPPGLGDAQIGALADHLDPQGLGIDADGVIGLVADVELALRLRLHIGANPAEIEQLGLGLQDGVDQFGGGKGVVA